VWHEEALDSLRRTLDVLGAAGVPALVVKGMVLAYSLHEDATQRPMRDVDVRVRPRDLIRGARAMETAGFPINWVGRQLGAVGLRVGNIDIDLEATIGPPGLCALSVAEMLERSCERVLPRGLRVREPEIHDHAVLLIVNAFKDKLFASMPWALQDLDTIATRCDVDLLLDRVRAARVQTITWIVADWMARERSSEAWRAIRSRLGRRRSRPLYRRALRSLIANHPSSPLTPLAARIASDSVLQRAWGLTALTLGVAVQAVAQRR
jgi:hypothetical protein